MELRNFISEIEKHLSKPSGTIAITQGSKKLKNDFVSQKKFSFNKAHIQQQFGDVETLLKNLPNHGFTDGAILSLRREAGKSHHVENEIVLRFNNPVSTEPNLVEKQNPQTTQKMENHDSMPAPVETPKQQAPNPPMAMGYTQVPQYEWINLNVQKERFADLLERLAKAEKDRDKAESDYRIEKERAYALERKLETIEDKYELKIERELNNKKSFFDSETGKEVIGALSANLGTILQTFKGGQPQIAMAGPGQELSPAKQQFIQKLGHIPEEFMPYLDKVAEYSFTSEEFYQHVNAAIMQLDQQKENNQDNA